MSAERRPAVADRVAAADKVGPVSREADHALLAALRTQTSCLHQELDARLQSGDGAPLTLRQYTTFLRATSAVVVPLEAPLALRLGGVFVHERAGERRASLVQDLADLDTALAPASPTLPAIDGRAAAMGAAYVILGSHLGGQMIGRGLFGRDVTAATPTRYVNLYGTELGPMWKRFTSALGAFGHSSDEASRQHVASVAVAIFTAFGVALDGEGMPR